MTLTQEDYARCEAVRTITASERDRLFSKIEVSESGCLLWKAGHASSGYGSFWFRRHNWRAHRLTYMMVKGVVPDGLQIDHLCRVRLCVNPRHLELVTARENIMRGEGITARRARKTHCKWGHEFTPENTYVPPRHSTWRICKACSQHDHREMVTEFHRSGTGRSRGVRREVGA